MKIREIVARGHDIVLQRRVLSHLQSEEHADFMGRIVYVGIHSIPPQAILSLISDASFQRQKRKTPAEDLDYSMIINVEKHNLPKTEKLYFGRPVVLRTQDRS